MYISIQLICLLLLSNRGGFAGSVDIITHNLELNENSIDNNNDVDRELIFAQTVAYSNSFPKQFLKHFTLIFIRSFAVTGIEIFASPIQMIHGNLRNFGPVAMEH